MKRLFDTSIELETRLFYVLAWTACIANMLGFVSNIVFFGMNSATIFCGVCAFVMCLAAVCGICWGKITFAKILILVVVNVIEFPFLYYQYGPGRVVYMLLGIVGIIAFSRKNYRAVFAGIIAFFDAVIIVVSVLFPSRKLDQMQIDDMGASVTSFLIVSISVVLILLLLILQQEKQNRELSELTEQLKDMANRDPLTSLYNRRFLMEYLNQRMICPNAKFSVALLDLDDFKSINDEFGHVYGDEVIQVFADTMQKYIDGQGIAARYGGEEFMLVFEYAEKPRIMEIISAIRKDLGNYTRGSRGKTVTFSGGIEVFQNEDRITKLFHSADEKLYVAKREGKNRVVF